MSAPKLDNMLEAPSQTVGPPSCVRCGVFAELLEYRSQRLCRPCLGRRHPVDRLPLTLVNLITGTLNLLWAVGPRAALGALCIEVPAALLFGAGVLPPLFSALLPALWGPVSVGLVFVLVHRYLGGDETPSVRNALLESLRHWPRLMAVHISVHFLVMFGLFLCVLPGLYMGAGMAIAGPIAVNEKTVSAGVCLGRSRRRLERHRWLAGLGYGLAFVPAVAAKLCLAMVIETAVVEMDLYDPLLLGAIDFTSYLATGLVMLPIFFVQAVLHAKTHPEFSILETELASPSDAG